jgi:hypothetical protein
MKKLLVALGLLTSLPASAACDITMVGVQMEARVILAKDYPQHSFRAGPEPDVIRFGEVELGLSNLKGKICAAEPALDSAGRARVIRDHFKFIMAKLEQQADLPAPQTWAEASKVVSLQFIPSDYLRPFKGKRELETRPFVPGVELAVVLDSAEGYQVLRVEDRAKWKVSDKELHDTALRNLDEGNRELKLQAGGGPELYIGVETQDGFDAVRLLLPWVRDAAFERLGDPFYAGISNRDFLILWSGKNGAEFQKFVRENLAENFASQAYPLTPAVLRVSRDGRVEVVK